MRQRNTMLSYENAAAARSKAFPALKLAMHN